MGDTYRGRCFCGAVRVEVNGDAVSQGYCHCDDCRAWSATPVTAYAIFPAGQVAVTEGADKITDYSQSGKTTRRSCSVCGGNLMTVLRGGSVMDVYPVLLGGFEFRPAAHVYYGMRVVDMPDGLPKFHDMPERAGGSGRMIAD